jgi:hypothetical protein
MEDLLNFQHIEPIIANGVINFCLEAKPNQIAKMPPKSQFSIVYSPVENHRWEMVNYRVIEPQKAYAVISRRELSIMERQYFENLLKFTVLKGKYASLFPHHPIVTEALKQADK